MLKGKAKSRARAAAVAFLLACGAEAQTPRGCPDASEPGGLDAMDAPVREEYRERLSALEALLARPDAPAAEVAQAQGRLGQWYHAFGDFAGATACYAEACKRAPTEPRWPYLD